jgi:hypothetical protein
MPPETPPRTEPKTPEEPRFVPKNRLQRRAMLACIPRGVRAVVRPHKDRPWFTGKDRRAYAVELKREKPARIAAAAVAAERSTPPRAHRRAEIKAYAHERKIRFAQAWRTYRKLSLDEQAAIV